MIPRASPFEFAKSRSAYKGNADCDHLYRVRFNRGESENGCGRVFVEDFVTNFLLSLTVKEL